VPDLLCTSPAHPHDVFYRLQKLDETAAKSKMLCPWCDWQRLYEIHEGGVVYTKIPDPYYQRDEWRAVVLQRSIDAHPSEQKKEEEPHA
jgi:hypothetical protein